MIILSNIIAIFRRELQSYFASPLAYIVATVFWLLSGFFFVSLLIGPQGIIQQVAISEQMGMELPPLDVAYLFITNFFTVMGSLILFILPILSMGLYAEERKQGTLELLATSPLTNWSVAVGKLLGVLTFFITLILPFLLYEAIAFSTANPPMNFQVPILAHLGLILLAASVLSLGMFISSLTNSSLIAAILTFALVTFLWIIDIIGNKAGGIIGKIFENISLLKNYNDMIAGVFNTSGVVVFFSYIFLGIFLTAQSIQSLRFQRF
jgi:ABC-2 type transport system permease protein